MPLVAVVPLVATSKNSSFHRQRHTLTQLALVALVQRRGATATLVALVVQE
jgi:hypothetical protein